MPAVTDNKWLLFRKYKLDKSHVKIIIQSLLLTILGFLLSVFDFQNFQWNASTIWLTIGTVATLVGYIASVVIYEKFNAYMVDLVSKKDNAAVDVINELSSKVEELTTKNSALKIKQTCLSEALRGTKALHGTISENLDKQIEIQYGSEIDKTEIYSCGQLSTSLCSVVHNVLAKRFGNERDFEVTYVRMIPEDNAVEMVGVSSYDINTPSLYQIKRPLNRRRNPRRQYCFEKILWDNEKSDPLILSEKSDILRHFYFKDEDAKQNCKYEQYIGIPVYRSRGVAPVGVLQVVSFRARALGSSRTMTELTCDVLQPLAYLSLLIAQSEKLSKPIQQAGGKVNAN